MWNTDNSCVCVCVCVCTTVSVPGVHVSAGARVRASDPQIRSKAPRGAVHQFPSRAVVSSGLPYSWGGLRYTRNCMEITRSRVRVPRLPMSQGKWWIT